MREELAALHALQQVEPADDGTVELREPAKMALRKRR